VSNCDALRFTFTITGYVKLGPRNSYLKEEGRGFNSTSGAHASLDESSSSLIRVFTLTRVGGIYGRTFKT